MIKTDHNGFKKNHEELAALKFLALYNRKYGTSFQRIFTSELVPDFRSVDPLSWEHLNFDETLATRSSVGPKIWKAMLKGEYRSPSLQTLDVEGELVAYRDNIVKKFTKRYGTSCALVVFLFGPVMP